MKNENNNPIPAPLLFKVLIDGKPCCGGTGDVYKAGKWTPEETNIVCCSRGYHLTTDPLRWWKPKAKLFIAYPKGKPNGDGTEKACFVSVKLGIEITKDWPWLVMMPRIRAFIAASFRSVEAKCDISWSDLSGANLSWSNLSESNLSESNLSWSNLSWSNLSWSDLSGANLSWSNLSGAVLSRSDLSRSNLSGANLSWSDLSGADLSQSVLSRSDLSRSNLSGANLSGANLSGAYRPMDAPTGYKINAEFRLEKL